MKSLSRVRLFVTPRTAAHQAPLSIGFSRQEYWSGLPFPPPGHLPNPGIKPTSPALQADALTSELPGKPYLIIREMQIKTTMRYQLPSFTMAVIKKQKIMSFGEKVEKLELLCTAGGKVKWYSYYGKQYGGSTKNLNRITIWSSNSASGYVPKRIEITISKRFVYPCSQKHYSS